ncbi:hypothetical protein ACIQVT_01290 [Streptomyces sp. NPDC100445]|uniref:hypothetical protein n=1 Tax=Streptomyces sp. NPDC100445 TaxID=3366102 RepID=UPI0037FECF04
MKLPLSPPVTHNTRYTPFRICRTYTSSQLTPSRTSPAERRAERAPGRGRARRRRRSAPCSQDQLRFIRIEAFDTDAAVTATELLRFGHSWAAVHAIHAARPSPAHPGGRYLLTLTPKAQAGTGVQAVHPDQ